MRNAFADELTKLGNDDPRIVMLSGDIGNKLFDKFKAAHPTRFINCGVAEAEHDGRRRRHGDERPPPGHLHHYALRHDALPRADPHGRQPTTKRLSPSSSVGAGFAYAGLGPTHHACEDIAFLRAIPNMVVICAGR